MKPFRFKKRARRIDAIYCDGTTRLCMPAEGAAKALDTSRRHGTRLWT